MNKGTIKVTTVLLININEFLPYFNSKFKCEGFFIKLNASNIPRLPINNAESYKHRYWKLLCYLND